MLVSQNPFVHMRQRAAAIASSTATPLVPQIPKLEDMHQYTTYIAAATTTKSVTIGNAFSKQIQTHDLGLKQPLSDKALQSRKRLVRALVVVKCIEEGILDWHPCSLMDLVVNAQTGHESSVEQLDVVLEHLIVSSQHQGVQYMDLSSYIQSKLWGPCGVDGDVENNETFARILMLVLNKGVATNAQTGESTRVFTRGSMNYFLNCVILPHTSFPSTDIIVQQHLAGFRIHSFISHATCMITTSMLFEEGWIVDFDTGTFMFVQDDERNVLEHFKYVCKYV